MNPVSSPYFVIAGPTGVGKSELAVALAEACGGEIVGADAFQVYDGLKILTAQAPAELRLRVPHHLVGEVPLLRVFDVGQYLRVAREKIGEVWGRGLVPIVTGGSGLYLRALGKGLADLPEANAGLRAELEGRPLAEIVRELAVLDPLGVTQIDVKNPRRVIRALEVCLLAGRPFSSFREEWSGPSRYFRGALVTCGREELNLRIDRRTERMFGGGVIEEVEAVGEIGATASQALGFREIRDYLAGKIGRGDCLASVQQSTRRYAKRQMTWFRREPELEAVDFGGGQAFDQVVGILAERVRRMASE